MSQQFRFDCYYLLTVAPPTRVLWRQAKSSSMLPHSNVMSRRKLKKQHGVAEELLQTLACSTVSNPCGVPHPRKNSRSLITTSGATVRSRFGFQKANTVHMPTIRFRDNYVLH